MRKNTVAATSIALAALLACACGEIAPRFSNVPIISFKGIRKAPAPAVLGDSVIVSIGFEDGDGDIGVQGTSDTRTKDFSQGFSNNSRAGAQSLPSTSP